MEYACCGKVVAFKGRGGGGNDVTKFSLCEIKSQAFYLFIWLPIVALNVLETCSN